MRDGAKTKHSHSSRLGDGAERDKYALPLIGTDQSSVWEI
jgi:hypothetical protein